MTGSERKDDCSVHAMNWQGIAIEVTYCPVKWDVIAHLEVRSVKPADAPLPISETGYRSWFHQIGMIEEHGGDVCAFVTDWLDHDARRCEWKAIDESSRQGSLF